jgi:hypothetical protein
MTEVELKIAAPQRTRIASRGTKALEDQLSLIIPLERIPPGSGLHVVIDVRARVSSSLTSKRFSGPIGLVVSRR